MRIPKLHDQVMGFLFVATPRWALASGCVFVLAGTREVLFQADVKETLSDEDVESAGRAAV